MAKAPLVTCADQMMEGMDCCDQDSGTCPDASNCALHLAAIALPVQTAAAPALGGCGAAVAPIATLHDSFIPDGPQRPPQALP
ncbi:hypothetical protein [Massilia sp. TSP1-1-2]|uniref:hypothetical protein n=1 Tax=unclassified Massilia TaxID=2609279 RepID=UPI003CF5451F